MMQPHGLGVRVKRLSGWWQVGNKDCSTPAGSLRMGHTKRREEVGCTQKKNEIQLKLSKFEINWSERIQFEFKRLLVFGYTRYGMQQITSLLYSSFVYLFLVE